MGARLRLGRPSPAAKRLPGPMTTRGATTAVGPSPTPSSSVVSLTAAERSRTPMGSAGVRGEDPAQLRRAPRNRPCSFGPGIDDGVQGAPASPAHRRVGVEVVPDQSHRLPEGPSHPAPPLDVAASELVAEDAALGLSGADSRSSSCPTARRRRSGLGGSPSRAAARKRCGSHVRAAELGHPHGSSRIGGRPHSEVAEQGGALQPLGWVGGVPARGHIEVVAYHDQL
jgi:hypothetical protein